MNRRNLTKNVCNPREKKILKSSPIAHGFGREIKVKRTTRVSSIHPPLNPKENGLKPTTINSPIKVFENHHKRKMGETQPSLEEPHRIIYTYHEGPYKV
jgi:hypothetical protein